MPLEFARALNCGGFGVPAAYAACKMMDGGRTFLLQVWPTVKVKEDVLENAYDGTGLIRISQIRDIQEFLRYRIDEGKKAVVVDYADRLMPQAANAFLKTLEEPPAGSVVMLISSRPSGLLPTILSRCQRMNFRPLPDGVISSFLVRERGAQKDEAQVVARLSRGSWESTTSMRARMSRGGVLEGLRGLPRRIWTRY